MTNGKFLLVLGLNALVSLAITLGVTDFTLNQREKMEDLHFILLSKRLKYTNPEADVIRYQANLDEGLSKYSGVEVFDAYKLE
ncbi:hypothetical protein PTQ24_000154 [Salmonella phage KKP_3822]|uniref:ABC transporter permease n=1 Tax=Salmonella phage KKP_3822 TaxID=3027681 RepID=A0AAX4NDA4_9CAUD